MTLEIRTSLLKKIYDLSLSQLVFLSLVLDNNQKSIKDIATIVSQVNDNEIGDLMDKNLIICEILPNGYEYKPTEKLLDLAQDINSFETFYNMFPTYVNRPDGTKGFLKGNKKKCEQQYKKIIKNVDYEHILDCLKYDIDNRTINGKLGYMKTMWKWLTQCEWEVIEEQMNLSNQQLKVHTYGTELL